MRKLTALDNFLNENNNLWDDNMNDVTKVLYYCSELLSADLIPDFDENTDEMRETLQEALTKFGESATELLSALRSIDGAGFLPEDTDGLFPESEEAMALLKHDFE